MDRPVSSDDQGRQGIDVIGGTCRVTLVGGYDGVRRPGIVKFGSLPMVVMTIGGYLGM